MLLSLGYPGKEMCANLRIFVSWLSEEAISVRKGFDCHQTRDFPIFKMNRKTLYTVPTKRKGLALSQLKYRLVITCYCLFIYRLSVFRDKPPAFIFCNNPCDIQSHDVIR